MTRLPLLTGLALRDLWVSFRLLGLLSLLVAAAVPTLLVPRTLAAVSGAPPGPFEWYAWAMAGAIAMAAGVAAWSLAGMRRRGTAAWLVLRAVPRAGLLLSWFVALALALLAGTAAGSTLAWFALGGQRGLGTTVLEYAAVGGALGAAGLLALSVGLLAGTFLGRRSAALLALLVTGLTGFAAASGWLGAVPEPFGGLALLATLDEISRPLAAGFVSAGLALSAAAALLTLAAATLDSRDL